MMGKNGQENARSVDKQMFSWYNAITRNQTTNERRAVQTKTKNINGITEKRKSAEAVRIFSTCDHCGFVIYDATDAFIVKGSGDRIHRDCFTEYMEEHMFDFVGVAEEDDGFDCGF